jgi:transcriptional regulator with XRE-family HTH domain
MKQGKWWDATGHTTKPTPEGAKEIGARIKKVREARGLRTTEFAELIGRDKSSISDVERGLSAVSLGTILHMSEALGVSPGSLLPDNDSEQEGGEYRRGYRHGYLEAISHLQEKIPQ